MSKETTRPLELTINITPQSNSVIHFIKDATGMISTMLIEDLPSMYAAQTTQRYMEALADGNKCNKHRPLGRTEISPKVTLQSLGLVLEEPVAPPTTPYKKPAPTLAKPPAAQSPTDVDLTCLNWLQNLKLMNGASLPTPPTSPEPSMSNAFTGPPTPPTEPEEPPIDYRLVDAKPPYSYAQLICMAMADNDNIMTLSAIYSWIRDNFLYYQLVDPAWHNSIRHNLSLNKSFIKVPRGKDEPGKGGFWRLDTSSSGSPCASTRKRKTTTSRRFRPRRLKTSPVKLAPTECVLPAVVCPESESHATIFTEDELSNTWLSTDNWTGTHTDLEFLDAILNNFGPNCTESCLTEDLG